MRDVAVALGVFLQIGVKEIQPRVADARLPDPDLDFSRGKLERDLELCAILLHRLDRQVAEVRIVVLGALPAFGVDRLHEVALAVEQADGDERQLEIARRLAVVAGEDAEAARVDRQAFVDAELRAEVRHQVVGAEAARVLPERRLGVIRVERGEHPRQAVEECRVGRGVEQALLVDALQHRLGAMADRVPERRVEAREQRARRPIPAVPEIAGELLQARDAPGQARVDFENVAGSGLHHLGALRTGCSPLGAQQIDSTERKIRCHVVALRHVS